MSKNDVNIKLAEDADKIQWDNYVSGQKDSVAYHLFAWKQAIENAYGFGCPYFMAIRENRICGILPTANIHIPFSNGSLVSLPYCDVGGILADSLEIAYALLNYARQYAKKYKIQKIEIRHTPELLTLTDLAVSNCPENNYTDMSANPTFSGKVRMVLELPGNSEILLKSFKSKLRSQVKKPSRDGLIASMGGMELLDVFYPILAENMKTLGSPIHTKNWFRNIMRYYGEKAKCFIVSMPDKTPAAGGIMLLHKKVVSIPWASSLQHLNRYNPNMFLYWSFLEFAADTGYHYFDFGRSTPGEGTYKFKAQWGARPQPLWWEKWNTGNNSQKIVNSRSNSNPKIRSREIAEKLIQKLPLFLATFIGSRFRKYISL